MKTGREFVEPKDFAGISEAVNNNLKSDAVTEMDETNVRIDCGVGIAEALESMEPSLKESEVLKINTQENHASDAVRVIDEQKSNQDLVTQYADSIVNDLTEKDNTETQNYEKMVGVNHLYVTGDFTAEICQRYLSENEGIREQFTNFETETKDIDKEMKETNKDTFQRLMDVIVRRG